MLRFKIVFLTAIITCGHWAALAQDADAGLLCDWFRRWRRPNQVPVYPTTAYTPTTANYAGLQPGQCMKTCQQTCSRVVVNYVPCTSYRTTYERVPVTQYRPQTSTDPCTGCTVTCMRPCTSYTYRTRRVPYTTYRPVYRRETYRVPVTTITNECNTCGVAPTCDTCATGSYAPTQYGQSVPDGTLSTQGTYGAQPVIPGATVTPLPTPADSTPEINPQNSNRSVIDGVGGSSTRMTPQTASPVNWALTSSKPASTLNRDWSDIPVADKASPITRKWVYSPARKATYVGLDAEDSRSGVKVTTFEGKFQTPPSTTETATAPTKINQGWKTVQW